MWNNFNSLSSIAQIIQILAIILVIIGGLLQGGKMVLDKRISTLKGIEQIRQNEERANAEKKLLNEISTLQSDLNEKTKFVDPYMQPIQSASATVYIIIQTNDRIEAFYMDAGGYLAYVKGGNEILLLTGTQSEASRVQPGKIRLQAVFNLDVNNRNIGQRIPFLKDAKLIQIEFSALDNDYQILEGKAICTINGNARLEFEIPTQLMQNKKIFIPDIASTFNKVLK